MFLLLIDFFIGLFGFHDFKCSDSLSGKNVRLQLGQLTREISALLSLSVGRRQLSLLSSSESLSRLILFSPCSSCPSPSFSRSRLSSPAPDSWSEAVCSFKISCLAISNIFKKSEVGLGSGMRSLMGFSISSKFQSYLHSSRWSSILSPVY